MYFRYETGKIKTQSLILSELPIFLLFNGRAEYNKIINFDICWRLLCLCFL